MYLWELSLKQSQALCGCWLHTVNLFARVGCTDQQLITEEQKRGALPRYSVESHPTSWHRLSSVKCPSCQVTPSYVAAQAWPQLRFPSKVVPETAFCSLWKFHNVTFIRSGVYCSHQAVSLSLLLEVHGINREQLSDREKQVGLSRHECGSNTINWKILICSLMAHFFWS